MITVLMPTYNSAQYIRPAVASILNQTYKNFELLIVDDGSKDNTENILSKFKDTRIRYIKKEHEGLSASLNFGLKISNFDWVARMDADDICHPERLEKQIFIKEKDENFISCTWSAYFNRKHICFTVETPTNNNEFKQKLSLHSYVNHPSVIFNKIFILSKGGYNNSINVYEDYELWLRIRNDVVFEVVPEYLLFMRINPYSLSRKDFAEKKKIILNAQKKYYPFVDEFGTYEKIVLAGWREFFYGDKTKARKFFLQLKMGILNQPRIIIAILLTFFSSNVVNRVIENRFKLKLKYYFNFFSFNSRELRKMFRNFIKRS